VVGIKSCLAASENFADGVEDNMQLQSIALSTTGYLRSSSPYHPHGAPIFPKSTSKVNKQKERDVAKQESK
jgi:hypothetical protein